MAEDLVTRDPARGAISRVALVVISVGLVVCAGLTHLRTFDWRSNWTIWAAAVAVDPDRPRAHVNYGRALQLSGFDSAAMGEYERAIALSYDARRQRGFNVYCRLSAQTNLAVNYIHVRRYQEAWDLLQAVLSDQDWPAFPYALYHRGLILARAGECAAAHADQALAMRLDGSLEGETPCAATP